MSSQDSSIARDLERLQGKQRQNATRFPEKRSLRESIPATTGVGNAAGFSSSGGSGIASPLKETSRVTKDVTVYDASGLVSATFNVATKITMKDAGGREVVFDYV